MNREISLENQSVWFDREATVELYRQTIGTAGADNCSCSPCKNFAAQRGRVFPEQFRAFLETIGIDPLKEWEAFKLDFGADSNGHLYGGWFVFVGGISRDLGGSKDSRKPFVYWFTQSFPTGTLPSGPEYCAVEFLVQLPWILKEDS